MWTITNILVVAGIIYFIESGIETWKLMKEDIEADYEEDAR